MLHLVVGHTPLCPAGHLPLKGGDRYAALSCSSLEDKPVAVLPISPLEGEMPGRAEGGIPSKWRPIA